MNFMKRFVSGLGAQAAPFGFGLDNPDTQYRAGLSFIGDVGANMLANNQGGVSPWQNLGASMQQAKEGALVRNRQAMAAQQMMQEAEDNRRKREEEAAAKKQRDDWISTLPPEQQGLARLFPEKFGAELIAEQFPDPVDSSNRYKVVGNMVLDTLNQEWMTPPSGMAGEKPPSGYRWDENGNLKAITGGPADPAIKEGQGNKAITTKMQNDAVAAQQAYQNLNTALEDYKTLLVGRKGENGQPDIPGAGISILPGKENDQIAQARTNLQLQLKELYNLGVLNGPDLSLMEQMIFDPQTSVLDPIGSIGKVYSAVGGWGSSSMEDRAKASIDNLQNILKTIVQNKTAGILRSGAETGDIPEGITPQEWAEMTDEERAAWQ